MRPHSHIWILGGSLFPKIKKCHLEFKFSDRVENLVLSEQAAIHVFQLPKWKKSDKILSEKDRWLCLFKEGKKLDFNDPPKYFQTKEMRQVMKVLKRFTERERDALMYQHRLHQMTKEQTLVNMAKKAKQAFKERDEAFIALHAKDIVLQEALKVKDDALKVKDDTLKEKEKEIERLKQMLKSEK